MNRERSGLVALVAMAALIGLALIGPASATQGEAVLAGEGNSATATTSITNDTAGAGERGLEGYGSGAGLYGQGGHTGVSGSGGTWGVSGQGPTGVYGNSTSGLHNAGVEGYVVGESAANPRGIGVKGGGTDHITGVLGVGGEQGVWGESSGDPGSIGVRATGDHGSGPALQTEGVTEFSRSGKITIPAGDSKATKFLTLSANYSDQITAKTLVLATLQQNRPGVFIQAAVPKAGDADGSITIHLNKAVSNKTTVAWFALN